MSKPPAFQLYASDFYVDTVGWTATEVGAYIRLLLHQWAEGPLPDDLNILARIAGVDRKTMGKFWLSCVGKKFVKNALGTWENSRLEETRKAQINYVESQRELGKIGADKRWKNHRVAHKNPNGENIALQSSSSSSIKKDISPLFFEDFWKVYPKRNGKKVGKKECLDYCKAFTNGDRELLIVATRNYAASKEAKEGYARDPIRFLKKEYWKDWLEVKRTGESEFV